MSTPTPIQVSHPLLLTASGDTAKATLTAPFDLTIQRVRAYTKDPAGLRVCRLNWKPAGVSGDVFWSPYDESSELWPPLLHLVSPDERPNEECAFTGMRLKAGTKYTVEATRLEGLADFEVELTFFATRDC